MVADANRLRLMNMRGENAGIAPAEKHAYRLARDQLIADSGASLWNLSKRAKLVSKDFIDYIHIRRTPARVRFTQALADWIVASMPVGSYKIGMNKWQLVSVFRAIGCVALLLCCGLSLIPAEDIGL